MRVRGGRHCHEEIAEVCRSQPPCLERVVARGHEDDLIQTELNKRLFRGHKVRDVDGIEGAAHYPEP